MIFQNKEKKIKKRHHLNLSITKLKMILANPKLLNKNLLITSNKH